jgi:hypothetical protein
MSRQDPADTAHTEPEDPRGTPQAAAEARPAPPQPKNGGSGVRAHPAQIEAAQTGAAQTEHGGHPAPSGGPAVRAEHEHRRRPPGHPAEPGHPTAHAEHRGHPRGPQNQLAHFAAAGLPWYGLDAGWQGARDLGAVSTGPDGLVEFGTLRHGDPAASRPDSQAQRRAVTVLTMARLGRRPLYKPGGGHAGAVEALSVGTAAALAGVGLVEDNWPWELDANVRQHWLDQQREIAYTLSETLGAEAWQTLTLPVGDQQQTFHYRESTYGWVMAAARPECFLAAYGRGVSAYSLAFVRVDPGFYV